MNHMFNIAIICTALLYSHLGNTASMQAPQVEIQFISRDGHPIPNVKFGLFLEYQRLTFQNCSDFMCVPSGPRYVFSSDYLGSKNTSANGLVFYEGKKLKTSKGPAKNLVLSFTTSGTEEDICGDGSKTYKDVISHLNSDGHIRDPKCKLDVPQGSKQLNIKLKCSSRFTQNEIEVLRDTVRKTCIR